MTPEGSTKSWSPQRKRFAGALVLFLAWIAALTALAVVSADRPADRSTPSRPAAGQG
jgi:hypothetical protein